MVKCALIADIPGWAFHNLAKGIVKYNPEPDLEIDIFYEVECRRRKYGAAFRGYDVLYPFSPFQVDLLVSRGFRDYITTLHMNSLKSQPGFCPKLDGKDFRLRVLERARRVSVLNERQLEMMRRIRSDTFLLRAGYDPELFYPGDGPQRDHLVVGWLGNPKKPYKRFDLAEAACDLEGIEFLPLVCASKGGAVQYSDLVSIEAMRQEFYSKIDVLLITSDHEGLPTGAIEAAACGVTLLSTKVGIMIELLTGSEADLLVPQDIEIIQDRLRELRDNRERCKQSGKRLLEKIAIRAWPRVVAEWIHFIKGERV